MDGKGAMVSIVTEFHLGSVEAGFAIDKITDGGVFDDHFGPEGIARKTKKVGTFVSGDFDNDVGPTG